MTLDGWTITEYMCAGLIPGVNIISRPRIFYLFTLCKVHQALYDVKTAVMAADISEKDRQNVMDNLMMMRVPPLSAEARRGDDYARMLAVWEQYKKSKSGDDK